MLLLHLSKTNNLDRAVVSFIQMTVMVEENDNFTYLLHRNRLQPSGENHLETGGVNLCCKNSEYSGKYLEKIFCAFIALDVISANIVAGICMFTANYLEQ